MTDRIYNTMFDLIPHGSNFPDVYTVVLLGYGDGAAPQIPEITWAAFRDRLESNMAFHPDILDRYEERLKDAGRIMDIPLKANTTQLRALGFQGI
jgi:hypothetical protein